MGINLGAALGAIIAGYLGQTWGWYWGFGAAGFGMLLGLVVFVWGKPWLLGRGEPPDPARLAAPRSEEHTSELQSLMRISYAVFCLKHKNTINTNSIHKNKQN